MKDIIIYKSQNADTRSAKQGTTKEELEQDTLSHINDVQNVGYWLADKFKNQLIERTAFVVLPFLFTLSLSCQLHKCLRIVWCIHYPLLSSVSLCSIWLF